MVSLRGEHINKFPRRRIKHQLTFRSQQNTKTKTALNNSGSQLITFQKTKNWVSKTLKDEFQGPKPFTKVFWTEDMQAHGDIVNLESKLTVMDKKEKPPSHPFRPPVPHVDLLWSESHISSLEQSSFAFHLESVNSF